MCTSIYSAYLQVFAWDNPDENDNHFFKLVPPLFKADILFSDLSSPA